MNSVRSLSGRGHRISGMALSPFCVPNSASFLARVNMRVFTVGFGIPTIFAGRMEGHAEIDMSVTEGGSL
jgi:hypothetical protein